MSEKGTKVVCCVCGRVISAWPTLSGRGWHVNKHKDPDTRETCRGYGKTFDHKPVSS